MGELNRLPQKKKTQDCFVKYAPLSLLALEYPRLKLRLIWGILGKPCSGSLAVFNIVSALRIDRYVWILPDHCDFSRSRCPFTSASHYASLCRHQCALPPILFPFLLCHHQCAIYQLIPTHVILVSICWLQPLITIFTYSIGRELQPSDKLEHINYSYR